MQIQTADDSYPIDIAVQSIGIAKNPANPERTYLLHCNKCGKEHFQIQGKLSRIIPWLEPTVSASGIHKCARCGNRFTIQDAELVKRVLVKITKLSRASFCCPICSRRMLLDEEECPRCRTEYSFHIVETS